LTSECIVSGTDSYENASDGTAIDSNNFTVDEGSVLLTGDDLYNGKSINASYDKQSCQYVGGITGTIVNYVPMLLALALLTAIAGIAILNKL